jgi:hypothetical protein
MDQVTKLFLVMLVGSILAGALVVATNPRYRSERVLRSNAHYYPPAPALPAAEATVR